MFTAWIFEIYDDPILRKIIHLVWEDSNPGPLTVKSGVLPTEVFGAGIQNGLPVTVLDEKGYI